jgi:hypothetical protein
VTGGRVHGSTVQVQSSETTNSGPIGSPRHLPWLAWVAILWLMRSVGDGMQSTLNRDLYNNTKSTHSLTHRLFVAVQPALLEQQVVDTKKVQQSSQTRHPPASPPPSFPPLPPLCTPHTDDNYVTHTIATPMTHLVFKKISRESEQKSTHENEATKGG